MMKHTPGPWMVLPSVAEGQFAILTKLGVRQDIAVTYGFEHTPRQANARLIAAAPDLLEALHEINNWLVCGCIATPEDMAHSFQYMQELSNAAIAKATGEQP